MSMANLMTVMVDRYLSCGDKIIVFDPKAEVVATQNVNTAGKRIIATSRPFDREGKNSQEVL